MAQPFLIQQERVDLTRVLANLYEFSGGSPRDRRVLIEQAGLHKFLPGIDLSGIPRTVAGNLVGKLEGHGYLVEQPSYHALGKLLSYLLSLGDLAGDDARLAAELIVRYELVLDSTYVGELRTQYAITAAAQPATPPIFTPPQPAMPATVEAIPFTPTFADEEGLERVINSADNFLDVGLLAGAIYCAQAVGRIELPEGQAQGTGFLIGPNLVLTNQHVLKRQDDLGDAVMRFGYMADLLGINPSPGRIVRFKTDFYHHSPAEKLDYALVRLAEEPLAELMDDQIEEVSPMELLRRGKHRGFLVVAPRLIRNQERVNVIGHPKGHPLKIVLTQNYIAADMSDTRVHYVADTDEGSSGSPVLNRNWEVVALHHAGKPYPDQVLPGIEKDVKGAYRVNEGIPMKAILKDLRDRGLEKHLPRR